MKLLTQIDAPYVGAVIAGVTRRRGLCGLPVLIKTRH